MLFSLPHVWPLVRGLCAIHNIPWSLTLRVAMQWDNTDSRTRIISVSMSEQPHISQELYNVLLILLCGGGMAKGRLQRTFTKISDFRTTPSPCPGASEFPKPPPSRTSASGFSNFYFYTLFFSTIIFTLSNLLCTFILQKLIFKH